MQHPLSKHTEVQALVESCVVCGGMRRYLQIVAKIVSYEENNGTYTYTLSTGDQVPQHNIQQVL